MEKLSHLLGSKFLQYLSLVSVEKKTCFIMGGGELWGKWKNVILLDGNDLCPSKL